MLRTFLVKGFLLIFFVIQLSEPKVILVHSIFRHGERTTDTRFMYPNDPYRNKTFYPYGNGQLTNEGKITMFTLGKDIRNRYSELLGDTYLPEIVDAWASSLSRTQAALQLVLTAMFPPSGLLLWNEDLKWQPIAYNCLPKEYDTLLLGLLLDNFIQSYNSYCKSNEAKNLMERAQPVLAYIRKHSGLQAYTPREFFFLYITLITEEHSGLKLPVWTKEVYPQPLADLIHLNFQLEMGTKELRRFLVGDMFKKILTDTENAISGKSATKIHLYSAHDVNVVYVLMFFDLMYKHAPGYGSTVVIEVHEEAGDHFIQVHYKESKHTGFKILPFPNEATQLHLTNFRNMVNDLFEKDVDMKLEENVMLSDASSNFTVYMTYYQIILILFYYKYIFQETVM